MKTLQTLGIAAVGGNHIAEIRKLKTNMWLIKLRKWFVCCAYKKKNKSYERGMRWEKNNTLKGSGQIIIAAVSTDIESRLLVGYALLLWKFIG